jgi:hypothetical protein
MCDYHILVSETFVCRNIDAVHENNQVKIYTHPAILLRRLECLLLWQETKPVKSRDPVEEKKWNHDQTVLFRECPDTRGGNYQVIEYRDGKFVYTSGHPKSREVKVYESFKELLNWISDDIPLDNTYRESCAAESPTTNYAETQRTKFAADQKETLPIMQMECGKMSLEQFYAYLIKRCRQLEPTASYWAAVKPKEEFTCGICGLQNDEAQLLFCGHLFCHPCINSWFVFEPTCPMCRQ